MVIHRYDDPDILSGQGTCGLEIAEQVDDIDAVVIPIGGGGLIAGSAVALKTMHPKIQIYVSVIYQFFKETYLSVKIFCR